MSKPLKTAAACLAIALVTAFAGSGHIATPAQAGPGGPEGMVMMKSPHSVAETLDRFAAAVEAKGLTVFTRIDHGENAANAGLRLDDTEVLIFGNPHLGTPMMRANRSIAIDLPQKAMAYKDGKDTVWLAYNDPAYLSDRHDLTGQDERLDKIGKALHAFARKATE